MSRLLDAPSSPPGKAAKPKGGNAVMASREASEADDVLDFYPTPPWAARAGGELIKQLDPMARTCWEPAAGEGHMAWGLKDYFDAVACSDIHDYGPHLGLTGDFLSLSWPGAFEIDWIVTNPPFVLGEAFIRKAWAQAARGVAMLLRLQFIEGGGRHALFTEDCPLTVLAPFCERVPMHKGRWEPDGSTTTAYAWFIFAKAYALPDWAGPASLGGQTQVRLIPPGTKDRLSKPGDRARFGHPETAQLDLGGEA